MRPKSASFLLFFPPCLHQSSKWHSKKKTGKKWNLNKRSSSSADSLLAICPNPGQVWNKNSSTRTPFSCMLLNAHVWIHDSFLACVYRYACTCLYARIFFWLLVLFLMRTIHFLCLQLLSLQKSEKWMTDVTEMYDLFFCFKARKILKSTTSLATSNCCLHYWFIVND